MNYSSLSSHETGTPIRTNIVILHTAGSGLYNAWCTRLGYRNAGCPQRVSRDPAPAIRSNNWWHWVGADAINRSVWLLFPSYRATDPRRLPRSLWALREATKGFDPGSGAGVAPRGTSAVTWQPGRYSTITSSLTKLRCEGNTPV